MTGATWFALTAIADIGLFGIALLLGRTGRSLATGLFAVAAVALTLKSTLHWRPDWEFALFPHPNYLFLQSWLGFAIAIFALGIGTGLLRRKRDRRALAAMAIVVFGLSLWSERWMFRPIEHPSQLRADQSHHCVQSTPWSCGAAASVSLLSYLGVEATEGEMIRLCRSQPHGGTSLFRICRGLRLKLGNGPHDVRIVDGDPANLRELGLPAIVTKGLMHVVTVMVTPSAVTVHDSLLAAPQVLSFDEYRARFSGYAVVVARR